MAVTVASIVEEPRLIVYGEPEAPAGDVHRGGFAGDVAELPRNVPSRGLLQQATTKRRQKTDAAAVELS